MRPTRLQGSLQLLSVLESQTVFDLVKGQKLESLDPRHNLSTSDAEYEHEPVVELFAGVRAMDG